MFFFNKCTFFQGKHRHIPASVLHSVNNILVMFGEDSKSNSSFGLVSTAAVSAWIKSEWRGRLLLLDSFAPHTAEAVQRAIAARNANDVSSILAIIPEATSPFLQPLHRGVKQAFRVCWHV